MSQRSQIYIRYPKKNDRGLIARDFHWNHANLMISRVRHTLEWIKVSAEYMSWYFGDADNVRRLLRVAETNFDYGDVAISRDIVDDWKADDNSSLAFADFVFRQNDCCDGKLLIDIQPDGTIKYALLDTEADTDKIMDAEAYMDWDCENWKENWRTYFDEEERKCVLDNLAEIPNLATLMTKDEVEEFFSYPYGFEIEEDTQYGLHATGDNMRGVIHWYNTKNERDIVADTLLIFGIQVEKWVSHMPYKMPDITYNLEQVTGYRYIEYDD